MRQEQAITSRRHVTLLTSWCRTGLAGSGVVTSVDSVSRCLAAADVEVDILSSDRERKGYLATLLKRYKFNYRLSPARFASTDLLLSFDFDGFSFADRLPCPLLQVNGGVLADIVRFERGVIRLLLRWQARLEGKTARLASAVITPSRYAAQIVSTMYSVPSTRIHVIPFGIDTPAWAPPPPTPPLGERPPMILCVAKLYPRKNVLRLVQAFTRVAEVIPRARLEIVGDGLQYPALRSGVSSHPARERIILHGAVPHHTLPAFYHRATVFCLPSLHETFGFAYLEAMAAGLPVVAWRGTAVPEIVQDGTTGLLAREDSPEELAALLIRVLRERELACRLGENGRRRAGTYSFPDTGQGWRKVVEDYCR
jgi:glycosyltransferase involved in cell wall biosynthesis